MHCKKQLKEKAIVLRRKGLSYSEILREVNVAKSTLSLWLRSVGLSINQKQKLTEKKLSAMRRGWLIRTKQRKQRTKLIVKNAKMEIAKIKINNEKL